MHLTKQFVESNAITRLSQRGEGKLVNVKNITMIHRPFWPIPVRNVCPIPPHNAGNHKETSQPSRESMSLTGRIHAMGGKLKCHCIISKLK